MADFSEDIADECRRKVIEADERAKNSANPERRKSYEDIAALWRKIAERAELSDKETTDEAQS